MLAGTLSDGNGGSFARVAGMMMVGATILLVFFLTAMLFLNICNPEVVGTETLEVCKRRFEPGSLAAFLTAGGGVLTAATVFIYRENKKAGG